MESELAGGRSGGEASPDSSPCRLRLAVLCRRLGFAPSSVPQFSSLVPNFGTLALGGGVGQSLYIMTSLKHRLVFGS